MQKKKVLIAIFFTFLTIVALINKITHGIDPDEEMAIVNMYRLSLDPAHTVFTLNWDALQLVATLFFPIIYLFKLFNYEYLVIGLRLMTILIQFTFIIYLSTFTKKYFKCSTFNIYLISCLLMLSYPKFIVSLDHSNPIMWFYTIFVIEMYKYIYPLDCNKEDNNNHCNKNNNKNIHIYLSGLSYSLAVLSHPGNILILPIVFIYLLKKKNIKDFFKFLLPCFIAFIIFFLIFLKDNTLLFKDPMFFIYEFTNEGSHKSSLLGKIDIRIILIFGFLFIIALVLKFLVKNQENNIFNPLKESSLFEILLLLYAVSAIGYNLLISHAIVVFSEKYLVLGIFLLIYFYDKNKNLFELQLFPIVHFVLLLIFTNQGIQSNCYYLLPISAIVFAKYLELNPYLTNKIIMSLYLAAALVIMGYNAKVEATLPSTILENKYVNKGVMSSIKTLEYESELMKEMNLLDLDLQKLTIISEYPHTLAYVYMQSEIIAPTCLSTPSYDDQWIDYFNYFDVKETNLLIDKTKYKNIEEFAEKQEFGKYLINNFAFEQVYEGTYFDIIKANIK